MKPVDEVTREYVLDLARLENPRCVTLLLPTAVRGQETREGPIRLRKLLAAAGDALVASGLRPPEARKHLAPAASLVDEFSFWQHQSNGLFLVLAPERFDRLRLPVSLEDMAVVQARPYLRPLLPLLNANGRFALLALSQNERRLYECDRYHATEVELAGAPSSLAEATRADDPEKQLQFHTGTHSSGGERPAMFHGQGGHKDAGDAVLLEYLGGVEAAVARTLLARRPHAPLVLAAVERVAAAYRELNSYPKLAGGFVPGNPEAVDRERLVERGWELVAPEFRREVDAARETYGAAAAAGRTRDDLAEVLVAGREGRIECLFVDAKHQVWGRVGEAGGGGLRDVSESPGGGREELLNLAAIQVLLTGGTVHAVPADELPASSRIAAVLRY
jgi:hypothetical protein